MKKLVTWMNRVIFVLVIVFLLPLFAVAAVELTPSDSTSDFGDDVSLDGDYALVGAPNDYDQGDRAGAAYIFKKINGVWIQIQKLYAADGGDADKFGSTVSLDGDYALIGAYGDNLLAGSAYIFKRVGEVWTQEQKLVASDGATDDLFGSAVSLSGEYALIGASWDDDGGDKAGSAYVFQRQGDGSWTQMNKLTAADGGSKQYFGGSVSVAGEYALVGAELSINNELATGSVYVFQLVSGNWSQVAKLAPADGAANDRFGVSVSLHNNLALIGAENHDYLGAAYVFQRNDSTWTEIAQLIPGSGVEYFGQSVSLDGDLALIGAAFDDDDESGLAYVFLRDGDTWNQIDLLVPSEISSYFAYGLSLDGNVALVGDSYFEKAYLFEIYPSYGELVDDFETGDFSVLPWTTSGDGLWQATGTNPYQGTYAAQSPAIDDNQVAVLETTLQTGSGQVSFWFAVDSEEGYDFLEFYIDGQFLGGWSGVVDYGKTTFTVPEGVHTFTWKYTKDSSGSSGADTAWIDDFSLPPWTTAKAVDFNNDGTHDVALFYPDNSKWYIKDHSNFIYGTSECIPIPGDYNGDGATDLAVVDLTRPDGRAKWYLDAVGVFIYGLQEWIPVPGDYNGDGITDAALFDPVTGKWYVRNQFVAVYGAGGIPVPGDYDGDGITDIAVFYPDTNKWYIKDIGTYTYGMADCIPVPADYDGDGATDLAVIDTSRPDGMAKWYIRDQAVFIYGAVADTIPVPGDYDGDGDADPCLFYQTSGKWYCRNVGIWSYGNGNMIPLSSNLATRNAISQASGGSAVW